MLRRLRNLLAVAVIAAAPAVTVLVPAVVHAAVDTCTWTGAVDGTFSNGANWANCDNAGVPENGDSLIFDTTASSNDPTNDMSSMSFADITFTGNGGVDMTVDGNGFTVTGNVTDNSDSQNTVMNNIVVGSSSTFDVASPAVLTFTGTVSGAGSILFPSNGTVQFNDLTLTGSLSVDAGTVSVFATSSADATVSSVSVAGGATFAYDAFQNSSVTTYTLSTPINSAGGTLDFSTPTGTGTTLNLTGTITLTGDTPIVVTSGTVVHVQGALHGAGFRLTTSASGQVLNESIDNTTSTPSGDINPAAAPAGSAGTGTTPGTPDTGFRLVSANPAASLGVTVLAAGSILAIARMTRKSSLRR